MMVFPLLMAGGVGLWYFVFWMKHAFPKSRPPPEQEPISLSAYAEQALGSLTEAAEGATYEYLEDGVTMTAAPGTEIHRLIEEQVRRL